MPKENLSALDQAAHWPVRFSKGHLIYDEGDISEAMYRVDKGCVRLQVNGAGGSRQIVRFLFPGDLFGICLERRNTAAEAVTKVELTRYSMASVIEFNAKSVAISKELLNESTQSYNELAHHVEMITRLPAVDRVVWFFDWLRQRKGIGDTRRSTKTPMSHRDIADYLGLTPETLSRCLKTLRDRGQSQQETAISPWLDQESVAA